MLEILLYKYLVINTTENSVTMCLWHEHGQQIPRNHVTHGLVLNGKQP